MNAFPDKETLREQLKDFGYSNIPEEVLDEFVADISKLYIGTPNSQTNTSGTSSSGKGKKKKGSSIHHREIESQSEETTTDQYSEGGEEEEQEQRLYSNKRQTTTTSTSTSTKKTTITKPPHSATSPHVRFEKENSDNQAFEKGGKRALRKKVVSSSSEYDSYTDDNYTSDAYNTDSSRPTTAQSDTESVDSIDSRDSFGHRERGGPSVIYSRPSSAYLVGIGLPCTGVRAFRKSDPVAMYQHRQKQWSNDRYLSNHKEGGDRKKPVLVEVPPNRLVLPPKKLIPATKSRFSVPTGKRRDTLRFELRAKLLQ